MGTNKIFGRLLNEGISSVAKRQNKQLAAVEFELAQMLRYSEHTIQHWRRGYIPPRPELVAQIVRYCKQSGRVDSTWAQSLLMQTNYPNTRALLDELFATETSTKPKVFLCYQRGTEPDERVALKVAQTLTRQNDVFFDQEKEFKAGWSERILTELHQSDFVIVFLSAHSALSEGVLAELAAVAELRARQHGRPELLPVRLDYLEPLAEPLDTYVGDVNWTLWRGRGHTQQLINQLKTAIGGGKLPFGAAEKAQLLQPARAVALPMPSPAAHLGHMEMPEGTMSAESAFYIKRAGDQSGLAAIAGQGVTIIIKGSRQVGKSSLLIRIADAAGRMEKKVVFLDFQQFGTLPPNADTFFQQFCSVLTSEVGGENRVAEYWKMPLPNPFRCTELLRRHLLPNLNQPLLLAMDEVDTIFETDFRTEFFGMLRSWHNYRAIRPIWRGVDLVLVTSTEPYYFIDNLKQSPFNVGEVIELEHFTLEQVAELNQRYGEPLSSTQVAQLMDLVHGHPYLVRRSLYLVASGRVSVTELFEHAIDERGPFGDHLRALFTRLYSRADQLQRLLQVLRDGTCPDEQLFFRLRGAGLVRREQNRIVPSCRLYAAFFKKHLGE
jgi:AAA-like domain/TIR domain